VDDAPNAMRPTPVLEAAGNRLRGGDALPDRLLADLKERDPRFRILRSYCGLKPHSPSIQPAGCWSSPIDPATGAPGVIEIRTQPATLSAHKIGDGGRLTLVRSYGIETNGLLQFRGEFVRL
jgi:hypothetical protein